MRESAVEKAIRKWAKDRGITMFKFVSPGHRGVADQLCLKDGKAGFLEVKRPGEKPGPLQEKFRKDRIAEGFVASWCDNYGDGVKWLRETFLK